MDPAVAAFLSGIEPALRIELEALRRIILDASPLITEGIKWKSPSFRTTDDFATMNIRKDAVWLILHTGAKAKAAAKDGMEIPDPAGLLEWLAKDRAVVKFNETRTIAGSKKSLQAIIREWIKHL